MVSETNGEDSTLEPIAKLVLKAAREMTTDGTIADATFRDMRGFFDSAGIIDLCLAIAFYNAVVRILSSLAIDVEDEYKPYLERFPLPAG